jgi:hypothetical protein
MRWLKGHPSISQRNRVLGLSLLILIALGGGSGAQSLGSESYELANNSGTPSYVLASQSVSDNSTASASITQSFSGLDGAGNPQTMTFNGSAVSRSDYGSLHVLTTGSLTNSYYNASNSAYVDGSGGLNDPNGSPTSLSSLGFAIFSDTLQYGGALQSGYTARYIFHVDGTNSGTGAAADLAVNVDSNPGNAFFDFNNGPFTADWATSNFAINGVTPQNIYVQFSDQVVFNTFDLTDGQSYTGQSDFASTLTLAAIEVFDQNGNMASGWTVSSASGTVYNAIGAVPEPGAMTLFAGLGVTGGGLLLRRRRR